jgi:hypothetical protein
MTSCTIGQEIAFIILREFERASELLGKAVVLSDGKAGVIEKIFVDELHGLRIAVMGHKGKWPIPTKFAEWAVSAWCGYSAPAKSRPMSYSTCLSRGSPSL